MCDFYILGLTWLFGFMVLLPPENDKLYLRFIFALIFSVLNVTQGIFILVWSINQRKIKIENFMLTQAFISNIQYDFKKTLGL
jgi:hypothetical protein